MTDARADEDRVAALLELAARAELEVRVLSARAAAEEGAPRESAACRVGHRVWVVLVPGEPLAHQAAVLAQALVRYRGAFLETCFVAPALRELFDAAGR